jgi:hypothetical protein
VVGREVRTLIERIAAIFKREANDDGTGEPGNVVDAEFSTEQPEPEGAAVGADEPPM